MPDYSKAKIYIIRNDETDKFYVGSTTQTLMRRWQGHKDDDRKKRKNNCQSRLLIWGKGARIELLEYYPCSSRRELFWRERYWIETFGKDAINRFRRPIETEEEKRETNRIRCSWKYSWHLKSQSREAENNMMMIDPSLFD